jgi:hypothetical protein
LWTGMTTEQRGARVGVIGESAAGAHA